MRRKNYYLKLEENRARNRKSKRSQLLKRRDAINAYQRAWYARNKTVEARKQNDRRIRRAPYIGVRKAIRDCERGTLELNGLIELVRQRFTACFGGNDPTRRLRPGRRRIYGPGNETIK